MAIPPAAIVASGALGGLFGGMGQAAAGKAGVKEQGREFNISGAPGMARAAQSAPLRDKLMQILGARFGPNPTTYTAAQGAYQPSQDLSDQEELYKKILAQMGYGPPAPPLASHTATVARDAMEQMQRGYQTRGY